MGSALFVIEAKSLNKNKINQLDAFIKRVIGAYNYWQDNRNNPDKYKEFKQNYKDILKYLPLITEWHNGYAGKLIGINLDDDFSFLKMAENKPFYQLLLVGYDWHFTTYEILENYCRDNDIYLNWYMLDGLDVFVGNEI